MVISPSQQCGQLLVKMVSLPSNQFPSDHLHAEHFSAQKLENHLAHHGGSSEICQQPGLNECRCCHVSRPQTGDAACIVPGFMGSSTCLLETGAGNGWQSSSTLTEV